MNDVQDGYRRASTFATSLLLACIGASAYGGSGAFACRRQEAYCGAC